MNTTTQITLVTPDWLAPGGVRAFTTTRVGGVSEEGYSSLNLGLFSGDLPDRVAENRRRFEALLPATAGWLRQVHGNRVHHRRSANEALVEADAVWTNEPNLPCTLLTADCLPILFCDQGAATVAAAHAGWRGLANGVLENTISALPVPAADLMAWIGPGIGVTAYEVGDDFEREFRLKLPWLEGGFQTIKGKVHADLPGIARSILKRAGVTQVSGGDFCTYTDRRRFFSHRRNPRGGRMATTIWREVGED